MNGRKILIKGNHDKKYDIRLFEDIRDFKTIRILPRKLRGEFRVPVTKGLFKMSMMANA